MLSLPRLVGWLNIWTWARQGSERFETAVNARSLEGGSGRLCESMALPGGALPGALDNGMNAGFPPRMNPVRQSKLNYGQVC